jgi:hypothetical protein
LTVVENFGICKFSRIYFIEFEKISKINNMLYTCIAEIFYNCQNETYILKLQVIILISGKLVKIKPSVIPNLKSKGRRRRRG